MAGPISYDIATLRRLCGEESATYAARKQRGGRAGQKGWRFEVSYAAYKIALQAEAAYQRGETGHDVWFQDQVGGFVDDLAVTSEHAAVLSQAKSGDVSWNAGPHPLANDFRLQEKLDMGLRPPRTYELVVSSDEERDVAIAGRPVDLGHVDIVAFRAVEADIQGLLKEHPELCSALDAVSLRKAQDIVREQTFQAFLGAWVHSNGDISLAELIRRLAERPDALLRVPGPDYQLRDMVAEHLAAVRNFSWRVVGMHLKYEVNRGSLSGWAAYPCGTPQFERFERFLMETRPTHWLPVIQELRREA